jgi:hypothetical protein
MAWWIPPYWRQVKGKNRVLTGEAAGFETRP